MQNFQNGCVRSGSSGRADRLEIQQRDLWELKKLIARRDLDLLVSYPGGKSVEFDHCLSLFSLQPNAATHPRSRLISVPANYLIGLCQRELGSL